uniref:Uncharacterized protein n=1 Tax=Tanacetum cinerariifolium TaxID=118510 RepID=A0A6L2LIK9_TANCI|nr:hypothetical protein [Tanacetum cinerariifolium]
MLLVFNTVAVWSLDNYLGLTTTTDRVKMRTDRERMYNSRFVIVEGRKVYNPAFIDRVVSFVEFACQQPTTDRDNDLLRNGSVHVVTKGFVKNYYQWTSHGEPEVGSSSVQPNCNTSSNGDNEGPNPYRNMILEAAGHDFNPNSHENVSEPQPLDLKAKRLYELLHQANEPLWPGCTKVLQFSLVSRMLNTKSESRMTEKIYDDVMQVLEDALPPDSKLVGSFYETKNFASDLGLPCEKNNCCINGCMLYWGEEDKDMLICKFCEHPRYKQSKTGSKKRKTETPHQFMHYFPLILRLQRLYASKVTATHMRWHDEHVQEDDVMSHPSDDEAWKHFDQTYPPFAEETRNVRLGLCTDGFQPFRQSGKQYSCWPVIVTPYNLPPWMCMKDLYMFLTIIVPGPKNPKQRIDIFLQPLIKELTTLWKGVPTYDISKESNFTMRAALLLTINDFLAYGMLSGWGTVGKKACPYCMRNKNDFIKNRVKLSQAPLTLTREQVIEQIDDFELKEATEIGGAEFNASISRSCGWRKRKTKDNAKERDDVKIYCKRKELEKNESTRKYPKACYSLGKEEKKAACDWVVKLKFPDGYVSNMARCVDMKKYKMFGMKSHDCHVFMQRLIPIAFRELLPMKVWKALIELSLFFKDLTCTTIEMDDMIRLQKEILVMLYKLERYFLLASLTQWNTCQFICRTKQELEGLFNIDGCTLRKASKKRRLGDQEYDAARTYVLLNCAEIEQYVKIFVEEIKTIEPNLTDAQVDTRYKFHTSEHGSGRSTYNSGVFLKGSNIDKVDWWAVSKAKPRSFIDLPGDNMAFQDDEVNTHSLDDVESDDSDDASLGKDTN